MGKLLLNLQALSVAFALFGASRSVFAVDTPVIEAIQGDQAVVVLTLDQQRFVGPNTPIQFWDTVITSPHSAAKVRFPDGTLMVVGRDSRIQIQPLEHGTQYNQLKYGEVRAQVEKGKSPDPKAPPKFVIRTKTAVMGVRGTDFVASQSSITGEANLHTIEGVVDYGSSESAVMSGKGTPVGAGQWVTSMPNMTQAAPTVRAFSRPAFEKELQIENPELVALADPPKAKNESDVAEAQAEQLAEQQARQAEKAWGPRLTLLNFSVGTLVIIQKLRNAYLPGTQGASDLSSQLVTFELAWNPTLRLLGPFTLRGVLGAFPLREQSDHGYFPGVQAGALLSCTFFEPLYFEAGPILESWFVSNGSGISLAPRANVALHFDGTGKLERIYVGVSYFTGATLMQNDTVQFHGGLGLRF